MTNAEYVVRETALVKINAPEPRREEMKTVAAGFGAKIVGIYGPTVVFEMTDTPDRLGEMIERTKVFGACEAMRSGSLAMALGVIPPPPEVPTREEIARAWWQADGAC